MHERRYVERSSRPVIKTILTGLLILMILATLFGLWYWQTYKKKIIRDRIEKAIADKNKGFYKVRYDSLDLDDVSGWLRIYNMHINFDSGRYALADKLGIAPPLLFTMHIPEIRIEGVKTQKALINKEIVGRKLFILNPAIDIQYTYSGKDSLRNLPTKEVYKEILGNMDLVQLDSIVIENGRIRTRNGRNGRILAEITGISLLLSNVRVDSLAYKDSSRYLFAKEISLDAKQVRWSSPDDLYNFRIENISGGSLIRQLKVGAFNITPVLGENAFANKLPVQKDRFNFSFHNILFTGIDLNKLADEYLFAETLTIGNSSFYIYRDTGKPRDKKNRIGHYPHQTLKDLSFHFNIQKIIIPASFVEYKERNNITRESGKVQFYGVNALISNFTNDNARNGNIMTAQINSRFLNKTPFTSTWTFYLSGANGRFDVTGKLGPIDAQQLNELTEPMGPATIKQGQLDGMDFTLSGSDHWMRGKIKLLYKDLKVALREKDKGAKKTDKKFLSTLLANIIIKNDNPKGNDDARIAEVLLNRDANRSMFSLCWKTLFKGIKETVGISK